MQFSFLSHRSDEQTSTRKLSLKKETLRQLTDGELRLAAGGGSILLSPSTSIISPSTSMPPSTSVIGGSVSTSAVTSH